MEIQQCLEILEVDEGASLDEVKESYKDLVNIWHPDRFSNNPRLKQKAEDKLKEINIAYEMAVSFLSSNKSSKEQSIPESKFKNATTTDIKTKTSRETSFHRSETENMPHQKTEAFFETGTEIILGLFSSLYNNFRRIVSDVKTEMNQETVPWQNNNRNKGKQGKMNACRGPGKGMGRGMGKKGGRRRGRN